MGDFILPMRAALSISSFFFVTFSTANEQLLAIMAPIIRSSMPANDLDLQHNVAPGDVATISAMGAKAIEHQNAFQPSLAQDSDKNKNNKWLQDMALNPSHIEIQPTTLASLHARDLESAINCNSFGVRGGHRCIGDGLDVQSRLRKHHDLDYKPSPNSKQGDKPKLSRRERNKKGFESRPCSDPQAKDEWYCKDLSPRDRDISTQALATLEFMNAANDDDDNNNNNENENPSLQKHHKWASILGVYDSEEEMRAELDAYVHRLHVQKRARQIGIPVGVVVGVLMLGLIFWYLRKRSKKLAAARAEGRVAELELETRRKGNVQGEQAGKF